MKKFNVRVLAEIAIFAAIGFVLDVLQGGIWKGAFPNGGSIGFAMIPVFIICYRRGLIPGLLCGLILSIVQMLQGVYAINGAEYSSWKSTAGPAIQIILDYLLAYTVVGFAGCFAGLYKKAEGNKKYVWIIVGVIVGGLLKYASHVISGGLFWITSASSTVSEAKFLGIANDSWGYSFLYNGFYCIPNIIISAVIMVVVAKFYPQFIDVQEPAAIEDTTTDNMEVKE